MVWTQADLDALRAAIASGALTVSYRDRTVTYHSLRELRELAAEMERQLTAAPTHRLAAHSKGV